MGKYIHIGRVLKESATGNRLAIGRYNSSNDQENKIKIGWEKLFYWLGYLRSPSQVESHKIHLSTHVKK